MVVACLFQSAQTAHNTFVKVKRLAKQIFSGHSVTLITRLKNSLEQLLKQNTH